MNVFIDWNQPCLPAVAAWLLRAAAAGELGQRAQLSSSATRGVADLSGIACVTPGRRAGRLLLAHLIDAAGDAGVILPPMTLTPGSLEPALLTPTRAVATLPERRWAWRLAIESFARPELEPLVPIPPADGPRRDPLDPAVLADRLLQLEEALEPQRIEPPRVPDAAMEAGLLVEQERWGAIAAIRGRMKRILAEAGLASPYDAWDEAIEQERIESLDAVVLIGMTELSARARRLLERFGDRVRPIVHAPEALAERFDDLGCVRPGEWTEARLSLASERIAFQDNPSEQASEALRTLATVDPAPAAEDVTIGLGDESLAGAMERAGRWRRVAMHDAAGRPMHRSGPYRLLEAIAGWLEDGRFAAFAELLRHPDLEAHLESAAGEELARMASEDAGKNEPEPDEGTGGDDTAHEHGATHIAVDAEPPIRALRSSRWISLLDDYYTQSLRGEIDGRWLGTRRDQIELRAVWQAAHVWLRPLIAGDDSRNGRDGGAQRPIGEWAQPILDVVRTVYAAAMDGRTGVRRERLEAAFSALNDAASTLARSSPALQPMATAVEAIRSLLAEIRHAPIPTEPRADEVEMLGWLELHLDPAPHLIIIGANEGALPATSEGDPFLPDRLREALGMPCDHSRAGRDAYLLEAIAHSRNVARVIAGRRTTEGEPISPSRLLFQCDDDALIERLGRFAPAANGDRVGEARATSTRPLGCPAPAPDSRFIVPDVPPDWPPPKHMSVTDFRTYLQCPYRYALSRLGGLEELQDAAKEMTPGQFGSLAHDVLQKFGEDESIREQANAKLIREFVLDQLHTLARRTYGPAPLPAVRVQVARLEMRLDAFARVQAEQRQAGWRIIEVERKFDDPLRDVLELGSGEAPMPLRGKVDRIDRHEPTGAFRIIDYKTSDRAKTCYEAHHGTKKKREEWIDLQLPLYHMLVRRALDCDDCGLAYMLLPKKPSEVGLNAAEWTSDELEAAIECGREVVRAIRRGAFERNVEHRRPWDPFARICQTNVFAAAEMNDAAMGGGDDDGDRGAIGGGDE